MISSNTLHTGALLRHADRRDARHQYHVSEIHEHELLAAALVQRHHNGDAEVVRLKAVRAIEDGRVLLGLGAEPGLDLFLLSTGQKLGGHTSISLLYFSSPTFSRYATRKCAMARSAPFDG